MRQFKIVIVLFPFLFLLACKNQSGETASDKTSTSESEQASDNTDNNLDLTKYGIANYEKNALGGLHVGETAPDITLQDQDGNEVNLAATLKEGPVILTFLRADWCSYCVKQLKEFQDHIQEIHDSGKANVIAISPQESSYMKKFHDENQLSFPILFDIDHVAMKDYRVFFRVTEEYNNKIKKAKGQRVEVYNGDTNAYLPVPATYLIDQDKVIQYVHYDPDYSKRANIKEVIAILEN